MAINVRGLSEHRPWPGYSAIHNAGQEPQQGQRVLQTLGTPKTLLPTPKYKVPLTYLLTLGPSCHQTRKTSIPGWQGTPGPCYQNLSPGEESQLHLAQSIPFPWGCHRALLRKEGCAQGSRLGGILHSTCLLFLHYPQCLEQHLTPKCTE